MKNLTAPERKFIELQNRKTELDEQFDAGQISSQDWEKEVGPMLVELKACIEEMTGEKIPDAGH